MFLVAGASSAVGQEAVEKLISRKAPLRVLVRTDADADRFRALGVEVAQGDVKDAQALAATGPPSDAQRELTPVTSEPGASATCLR